MNLFLHYFKTVRKILASDYPYGRMRLIHDYSKLIIRSILYHKLNLNGRLHDLKSAKVLGFEVKTFTYPQLINLFEEIFIYQVYQFKTSMQSPLIIDCGSNIGISILYFKKLYPDCRILAFEPDHETFVLLDKNIKLNNLVGVTLYNFALSDFNGDALLYKNHQDQGSLNSTLIKSESKPFYESVTARKLSDFIKEEIDLIKIDVEGGETNIIDDLISNSKIKLVKEIILEFHPNIVKISSKAFADKIDAHNFSVRHKKDLLSKDAPEIMMHFERTTTHS
jgi:FkbM family methyltransferase